MSELSTAEALRRIHAGRARIYDFLSRGFLLEADRPYLETIRLLAPDIEAMTGASANAHFKKGGALLGDFAARVATLDPAGERDLILGLAPEFATLFLTGAVSIPTSASVYLSAIRLENQWPRDAALKAYRRFGYRGPEESPLPEDHVGHMLGFMARLCDEEALSAQRRFLEAQLLPWIDQFCGFLIRGAEDGGFYCALAHLTWGFVEEDHGFLSS